MPKLLLTWLALIGLTLSAQAQVPMTGAGLGAPVAAGGASVTLDHNGTEYVPAGGATALNGAHTYVNLSLSSNLTKAAVVASIIFGTNPGAISATWANNGGGDVAMTQIGTTINNGTVGWVAVFGIVLGNNPASGAGSFKASWNSSNQAIMAQASSFYNVNQTFGTAFTASSATGNSSSLTDTVTSATGHYVYGAQTLNDNSHFLCNSSPAIVVYTDNTTNSGTTVNSVQASGNVTLTSGSYTTGVCSVGASAPWSIAATDISP